MEGYHWASVASPNETPIVTSLIYPTGVPSSSPPFHIPLPFMAILLCGLLSLQFSHYSPREGLGGGWQGRSGVVEEEGFCPWMSECG